MEKLSYEMKYWHQVVEVRKWQLKFEAALKKIEELENQLAVQQR